MTEVLPLPVVEGGTSEELECGLGGYVVQGPPSKGQHEPRSVPVPQELKGGHMTSPVVSGQYFSPRASR